MANAYIPSANAYKVDTEGADLIMSHLTGGAIPVGSIRWDGMTTAGHQAIIKDADGDIIWQRTAQAANDPVEEYLYTWWRKGFAVTELGSGILWIHFR